MVFKFYILCFLAMSCSFFSFYILLKLMHLVFLLENKASLLLLKSINKIICFHILAFPETSFMCPTQVADRAVESTGADCFI